MYKIAVAIDADVFGLECLGWSDCVCVVMQIADVAEHTQPARGEATCIYHVHVHHGKNKILHGDDSILPSKIANFLLISRVCTRVIFYAASPLHGTITVQPTTTSTSTQIYP